MFQWFSGRAAAVPEHVPSPDKDRTLVLYKFDACPYCRAVQRQIIDLDLSEVGMEDIRRDPSAMRTLREATGATQVPCLFIDGQPLLESADINAWLTAYAARND